MKLFLILDKSLKITSINYFLISKYYFFIFIYKKNKNRTEINLKLIRLRLFII